MDLSYNEIVSLKNTNLRLKRLVKLSLKKNKLVDLKGIENFPHLNYLKLSRNSIESLVEVKRLGNLPELKGVSLYRNPINDDKKLYASVILRICKKLESLDHTSVEEIRKKYGIDEEGEIEKKIVPPPQKKKQSVKEDSDDEDDDDEEIVEESKRLRASRKLSGISFF